jgi:hypothetical protein
MAALIRELNTCRKGVICVSRQRGYGPPLERELGSILDREAKARHIHMTTLANSLIKAALRYEGVLGNERAPRIAETGSAEKPAD